MVVFSVILGSFSQCAASVMWRQGGAGGSGGQGKTLAPRGL